MKTTTSGIDIPMELPGSHMEPDVLETLYLSQHSLSDNSRRLVQTSNNRTQSVYLSDIRVDTSNQLDADDDCKQSYSACDTEMHANSDQLLFACEVCDRKFVIASQLTTHMIIHRSERPFSCDVCDKRFIRSSHLRTHMRIHTGERPFVCKVCDKKFAQSSTLNAHMRIHTGERPFVCQVCDKKFTQSSTLKAHMRIHTGEKRFSCGVCAKKFARAFSLRTHMCTDKGEQPVRDPGNSIGMSIPLVVLSMELDTSS